MSRPPTRSTKASPATVTLKLRFVIPPPSGSIRSTPPGQTRRGKLVRAHERMRVPAGSNSGSAATSPPIHSPKISTSTGLPTVAAAAGR